MPAAAFQQQHRLNRDLTKAKDRSRNGRSSGRRRCCSPVKARCGDWLARARSLSPTGLALAALRQSLSPPPRRSRQLGRPALRALKQHGTSGQNLWPRPLQCYTQESCFLGKIFSADHVHVVRWQWLQAILYSPSSILFGCGFAALCLCGDVRRNCAQAGRPPGFVVGFTADSFRQWPVPRNGRG